MEPNARQTGTEDAPAQSDAGDQWRPAFDDQARRLPDFFLVGHPKCGTTALHQMLRAHPQLFMPDLKEPRFMGSDIHFSGEQRKAPLPRGLDEYLALFEPAGADQHAGEASPMYLVSHRAAGEIAAIAPQAQIIAIIREPASFLRSLHLQLSSRMSRTATTSDVRWRWRTNGGAERTSRDRPFRPEVLFYSDHVRYVEQLRRYEEFFPREQLLVVDLRRLPRRQRGDRARVLRFLGVDEDVSIEAEEANPTVRVRPSSSTP